MTTTNKRSQTTPPASSQRSAPAAHAARRLPPVAEAEGVVASAEQTELVAEYGWYTYGATSFADLEAAERAAELQDLIERRTYQYNTMVSNVMYDPEITDKRAALMRLTEEFAEILDAVRGAPTAESLAESADTLRLADEFLSEVQDLAFAEADAQDPRRGLFLTVKTIRPGFGNRQQNNHYSRELLAESAPLFVGARMYESNHDPRTKSTRTWVSTLVEHLGFAEDGGPLYKAYVHDPDFAQRTMNLYENHLLDSLHCSILGQGRGREGVVDGKRCKIVEAITHVESVDWVTQAGAGGHAVAITESEPGGGDMDPEQTTPVTTEETQAPVAQTEPPAEPPAAPVDSHEADVPPPETPETLIVSEAQDADPVAEAADPPSDPATGVSEASEAEEVPFGEADVQAYLTGRALNPALRQYLGARAYEDQEHLIRETEGLLALLGQLSGNGQPFGIGEGAAPTSASQVTIEEAMAPVIDKYFI